MIIRMNKMISESPEKQKSFSTKAIYLILISFLLIGIGFIYFFMPDGAMNYIKTSGWKYFLIGALAELANGTIGMAYGITTATALLSMGIAPIMTSGVVHISEIFTGSANGIFHFRFRNINKLMFKKLLYPSMAGAVVGAVLLFLLDKSNHLVKTIVYIYILILGIVIFYKALQKKLPRKKIKVIGIVGFITALFDSFGCGGYGTTASTTLIAGGRNALRTIGAVSGVKFFVATASSITLVTLTRSINWTMILMLVLGGLIVSPVGPYLAKHLPKKALMIFLAVAVIIISLKQLFF